MSFPHGVPYSPTYLSSPSRPADYPLSIFSGAESSLRSIEIALLRSLLAWMALRPICKLHPLLNFPLGFQYKPQLGNTRRELPHHRADHPQFPFEPLLTVGDSVRL